MDGSGTADQVERAAQSPGDSMAGASHTREFDPLTVTQRLQREGRWKDIEPERNEMMKLARKRGMSKTEAQQWVYGELDRMYPPSVHSLSSEQCSDDGNARSSPQKGLDSGHIQGQIRGLGDIPDGWPELPANASLSSEIGWVQANRLRVVDDMPAGPTVVALHHALSPAPSWSALGWLETSIRSYAKYVDVAARATASDGGEAGVMRHERMALEEVQALLDEMMDVED